MKGDLSRDSFDRTQHYSAVRLQQGRIVTDADWNEQADITRYRAERQARDTIGACGAPIDAAGYRLVAETRAFAVHAIDENTVWIAAEDGALLVTTNGGADWALADLSTAEHLNAIASADGVGWVVGDAGTVRNTNDDGASWSAQGAGTSRSLRGVAALDADRAWAVGDGGVLVMTVDGGASWQQVQTEASRLYAIGFADASNGLAIGQGGAILETGDGGETWSTVESGSSAHLFALARVGTTLAWAAGQGGTILRSSDGGASWQPCATPSTNTLHAIAFRDENEGWAVGEAGIVLHSADGGATWQREDAGDGTPPSPEPSQPGPSQPGFPQPGPSWRGLSLFGTEPAWAVGDGGQALRLGAGSPAIVELALPAVNLSIEPGRFYAHGVLCELEARCSYAQQPDGGAGERLAASTWLIYLEASQRHVSALTAPAIREIALGGPDTATRSRTVAQVRALPLPSASPSDWNCDSSVPAWDELLGQARPRLTARAEPRLAAANLCEIAASAGYRRLENQLYRVEVHAGGASPSFKWSRENGSVAYAVVSLTTDQAEQQTTVRLAARGRDENLDLAAHDRVELIDDDSEAMHRAGQVFEYLADGDDALELVLAGLPQGSLGQDPDRHPLLRRWDHRPPDGENLLPIDEDVWIELEDGVQVRFESGGVYRPGDHWMIPARTASADLDWPRDPHGEPLAREPDGIVDARCRLGIVEVDALGTITVTGDCRDLFPPLTALEQLLYVGGDGQDGAPGALLPQPLELRVVRGSLPVGGARVRFEVVSGDGQVDADGSAPTSPPITQFDATTDASGLASCRWMLGAALSAPARHQRVHASRLDADDQPVAGQQLAYGATATLQLLYVSGDGQQVGAGATLPSPLEMRVVNGGDGIAGVALAAAVEQGGGSLVGPATVDTDADGYAAFGWRLGGGGRQRLAVRLDDAEGNEVQRLAFNASLGVAATGGCDITIGRGGQFERLDRELLQRLLEAGDGMVCICFMPGVHEISGLRVNGNARQRLSLHGCGPTAMLAVADSVFLTEFGMLELRDLSMLLAPEASLNFALTELRLAGLDIERREGREDQPCVQVNAQRVRVTGCSVRAPAPAQPAIVFDTARDCQVAGNRFDGGVGFYGAPDPDRTRELLDRLSGTRELNLQADPASRLLFVDNQLSRLTIGARTVEQLFGLAADGLFESATLHGNSFAAQSSVFACRLLSFDGNSFLAEPRDGTTPYGLMIANGAAAAGNAAVRFGDEAILHFVTTAQPGFRGAANLVFTLPQS